MLLTGQEARRTRMDRTAGLRELQLRRPTYHRNLTHQTRMHQNPTMYGKL